MSANRSAPNASQLRAPHVLVLVLSKGMLEALIDPGYRNGHGCDCHLKFICN